MKLLYKHLNILAFCCLAVLLISMQNVQVNNDNSNNTQQDLSNSALIDNSLVTYNSIAERVVGSLNVQVDLRVYGKTATTVNMTITFSNTTVQNITLSESPTDVWKGMYVPNPTAPLGAQSFIVTSYDGTHFNISNSRTFYIYSCAPKVGITLSTTQLYRNNSLQYNITPSDGEDPVSKLSWTINVKTNAGTILSTNSSVSSGRKLIYWYRAESTYLDANLGSCYVQVTVTDSDGNQTINRAYFNILNNAPTVKSYTIEFSDTPQTDPEDKELLRVSGIMTFKLNVTDIETIDYIDAVTNLKIKLRLYAIGPNNNKVDFASKIQRVADQPAEKAHFKCVTSVLKSVPAGAYKLYIVPYQDPVGGSPEVNSTATYDFTIVNNVPNATKITYTINDLQPASLGLSFQEYERLTFKINVTNCDAEGITYVKL